MTEYNRRMSFSRNGSLVLVGQNNEFQVHVTSERSLTLKGFCIETRNNYLGGASSAFVFFVPHLFFRRFTFLKTKMDVPSHIP